MEVSCTPSQLPQGEPDGDDDQLLQQHGADEPRAGEPDAPEHRELELPSLGLGVGVDREAHQRRKDNGNKRNPQDAVPTRGQQRVGLERPREVPPVDHLAGRVLHSREGD